VRAPASFKYGHFAGVYPLSMSVLREKREKKREKREELYYILEIII